MLNSCTLGTLPPEAASYVLRSAIASRSIVVGSLALLGTSNFFRPTFLATQGRGASD